MLSGLLVTVVSGVALGFVFGAVLLAAAIAVLRRYT